MNCPNCAPERPGIRPPGLRVMSKRREVARAVRERRGEMAGPISLDKAQRESEIAAYIIAIISSIAIFVAVWMSFGAFR